MALLCKCCHADVTEDMAIEKPRKPFTCKCGSKDFRYQPDESKVDYTLSQNDRRLLKRMSINGTE